MKEIIIFELVEAAFDAIFAAYSLPDFQSIPLRTSTQSPVIIISLTSFFRGLF